MIEPRITDPYATARARMIESLRARGIRDRRVLEALASIPREQFVEPALAANAYGDHALPIGSNQTISQPYIVARMTELLEIEPSDTVLEIGSGCGYQTAVLSKLVARVYSIERVAALARGAQKRLSDLGIYNVTVKCFDGTFGWSEFAPYRGILVAAGGPDVPRTLTDQLAIGGRLVIPVGSVSQQNLIRITRQADRLITEDFGPCVFVKLVGRYGWED